MYRHNVGEIVIIDPAASLHPPHHMASPSTIPTPSREGQLILWGSIDPAWVDEDALNDWWTNEHLPERVRLPGFQLARRYRALEHKEGLNEYLALYQVSNVRDLISAEYLHALNHPTIRTKQFMRCLMNLNRFACGSMWEKQSPKSVAVARHTSNDSLFMVVCGPDDSITQPRSLDMNPVLEHLSHDEHHPPVDIVHARLAMVSPNITAQGSTSRSYDGVGFDTAPDNAIIQPRAKTFVFLFDLCTPSTSALTSLLSSTWFTTLNTLIESAGLHILHTNTYSLIATLAKDAIDAAA